MSKRPLGEGAADGGAAAVTAWSRGHSHARLRDQQRPTPVGPRASPWPLFHCWTTIFSRVATVFQFICSSTTRFLKASPISGFVSGKVFAAL
jgi:hypothetical protein